MIAAGEGHFDPWVFVHQLDVRGGDSVELLSRLTPEPDTLAQVERILRG
jgi:hypothetical protein